MKLIPAQFVKPFVKSNKNDFLDAEAIAEAVERKNMRFVPIKTDDQLDLQAIHRVRDRLIARRTSVINQLRAFLLERGLVFAKTPAKLQSGDAGNPRERRWNLTPRMRNLSACSGASGKSSKQQIVGLNVEVEQIASADPACTTTQADPRHRSLVATAIVAAIGNGAAFHKGREFSCLARDRAATVLDRRQGEAASASASAATATCERSSSMVHGLPCSASSGIERRSEPGWMRSSAELRQGRDRGRQANKLARIAWAVLSSGEDY